MGTQQLLLIILGVVIIGVAMAVGLSLFSANSVQSNKEAIIHDVINIFATSAYQHYLRPSSMGGGQYSYTTSNGGTAYKIPKKLLTNANGTYEVVNTATTCTIKGKSTSYPGNSVSLTIGIDGKPVAPGWVFSGVDFN